MTITLNQHAQESSGEVIHVARITDGNYAPVRLTRDLDGGLYVASSKIQFSEN